MMPAPWTPIFYRSDPESDFKKFLPKAENKMLALREIEAASKAIVDRTDLNRAYADLVEAQQLVEFGRRKMEKAEEIQSEARLRMKEACERMDAITAKFRGIQ